METSYIVNELLTAGYLIENGMSGKVADAKRFETEEEAIAAIESALSTHLDYEPIFRIIPIYTK